jgi:phosphopantothenoylcysteine synthetase/decarboxylase
MSGILLVGGAPRVRVDAVRHLTVAASGETVHALHTDLSQRGIACDRLLSVDAARQDTGATRYSDRAALETCVHEWIVAHPTGCVVLSAAVNDYETTVVESRLGSKWETHAPGTKLASGADELVIRLRPVGKLIDRLRQEWGLRGRLVGFKYEDGATVVASAHKLGQRCGADLVVANSLDGHVQALVGAENVRSFSHRASLLIALADQLAAWQSAV